jgi:chromosome segregation ATPase
VPYFPSLGIGVTIGKTDEDDEILRLCYESGELLPTGGEKAAEEKLAKYAEATRADMAEDRAERERARAERERARAEQEKVRAEREKVRAEQEKVRAEQEKVRAERAEGDAKSAKAELDSLREILRKLGVDPDAR